MLTDIMLVYHFLDPDLRVKIFFKKDEAAENGGVDFEVGDIGTSAHLCSRLKRFHADPVCFLIILLVTKK